MKKNLDQFLTLNLDQFLTLKPPNLGPVFNFTAYIYIYIQFFQRHCVDQNARSYSYSFFIVSNESKMIDAAWADKVYPLRKSNSYNLLSVE